MVRIDGPGAPRESRDREAHLERRLSLRAEREAMGLSPLDLADRAGCPVEVLLRAELGISLPRDEIRARIAAAYRIPQPEFLRLAIEAAERAAG